MFKSRDKACLILVLTLVPFGLLCAQSLQSGKVLSSSQSNEAVSDSLTLLADSVATDSMLQDNIIIAVRSALGTRGQTTVNRRGSFADEIRIYIETYRSIRDSSILANIQNRYSAARAELLDARLPYTIEELVALLEKEIDTNKELNNSS